MAEESKDGERKIENQSIPCPISMCCITKANRGNECAPIPMELHCVKLIERQNDHSFLLIILAMSKTLKME